MDGAIALNRFGLGARPGERARLGGDGREWLAAQARDPAAFALARADLPSSTDAGAALRAFLEGRRERRRAAESADPEAQVARAIMPLARMAQPDIEARTARALTTETSFAERLVWFWSNHFTVSATKAQTIAYVGPFEREAVRAHLHRRFADLLRAAVLHPGMLLYLDQAQSIGPNSRVGARRDMGLNENLAREILELHTIGVHAGYTQEDVTEFAKALTGWTLIGRRTRRFAPDGAEDGEALFVPLLHEPGARTIIGKRYAEGGAEQALSVLDDLARHPATARRIATKLARHFIADDPPPAAVARIERAFLENDGDLPTLHSALAACPEAAEPALRKFKTPQDFLISACRMIGLETLNIRAISGAYQVLGQPVYRAPSPAGWDDVAEHWAGPDAIMKRLEWSQALAARMGGRMAPEQLLDDALGAQLGAATRSAVSRAESAEQGLALALMSPEFQRR